MKTKIILLTIVFFLSISTVQAISYPCEGHSICARDATLYDIWKALGNITDEYTTFIYYPSNNTFIANATFLGHNLSIRDAIVKDFRKWIGCTEPANYFYVENVTFYGAPDSFGYYTFFKNVTIYGYGLNDTSSITGDLDNVTIYNATVSITSHGEIEDFAAYNSDIKVLPYCPGSSPCQGYRLHDSRFIDSTVIHQISCESCSVSTQYIVNVTYINSTVTLPEKYVQAEYSSFINSTAYLPESSFTVNNVYFEGDVYAVGSRGTIKNTTILGRLLLDYIRTPTENIFPSITWINSTLVSTKECSLSITSHYPSFWYVYNFNGLKLISETDYQTEDICVFKDYMFIIKGLEMFGNVTLRSEFIWDAEEGWEWLGEELRLEDCIIHDRLYLKSRGNPHSDYIYPYLHVLKVKDNNHYLLIGDTVNNYKKPELRAHEGYTEFYVSHAWFDEWVYSYVTQNRQVRLYPSETIDIISFEQNGSYYNFTLSSVSDLVTIYIGDLQPYQIADVYYDTGDGEVKELGRFYGDENGVLKIFYDEGSDPTARIIVKLSGTGLPPTATPPPEMPTPTPPPVVTTTPLPPILIPAEEGRFEIPSIVVINLVIIVIGAVALVLYTKRIR
ncbi:MAG: hypothetical protein ACXQS2_01710 [Methermicoccaceae archaeon]